ncbi:PDZ and LIM domain protein Zasp [Fasciola hepatica]|uniref:PDZ and LIM domain protein Zasp n=1 Tax=Fasciola hepatica TaxID=6192 RepID=A0A2H1C4N3_FASHE|nr:PDZ and LIM domain protein Zasp [Fasciola hepatica]
MAVEPVVLSLRRPTSDKSWGFALEGGVDQGLPVFVHKVTRNGIAHKCGVEPGDVILKICATPVAGMTHAQVKAEILRAGNDLDFTVKKRDFNVAQYKITVQQFANANINVKAVINPPEHSLVIVKEPFLWRHGGPTLKNDQPKSHKVLEQQIPRASVGAGPPPPSVFVRNMEERSPYLQATEQTIQKAHGQS